MKRERIMRAAGLAAEIKRQTRAELTPREAVGLFLGMAWAAREEAVAAGDAISIETFREIVEKLISGDAERVALAALLRDDEPSPAN